MNKQEDFFSSNHKRLLNIATWAKYMAWIVLVFYILNAIGVYSQEQYRQMFSNVIPSRYINFVEMLKHNPLYAFSLFVEIFNVLLRGFVYFLMLKGVSAGLNIIVETDINYREQKKVEEVVQQ